MTVDERTLCATTASWLAGWGRSVAPLGLGTGAAALWLVLSAMPLPARLAAAVVLLTLPAERLLALRLAFDRGLFHQLASAGCSLTSLDAALAELGLRRAAADPRALLPRVAGVRRLTLQHAALLGLQVAALLVAATGGRP